MATDISFHGCLSGLEASRVHTHPPSFNVSDAKALPYPVGTFDVVIAVGVLHHLSGDGRLIALREINRVLKPGGISTRTIHLCVVSFGWRNFWCGKSTISTTVRMKPSSCLRRLFEVAWALDRLLVKIPLIRKWSSSFTIVATKAHESC